MRIERFHFPSFMRNAIRRIAAFFLKNILNFVGEKSRNRTFKLEIRLMNIDLAQLVERSRS